MPATVGQAIINARQVVPDMPQVLPPTVSVVGLTAAIGSTLPAGTYSVVVTQRNAYGETTGVETTGIIVGVNQGIQITSPLQPSATTIRAYLTLPGGAAGSEQQYIESTVSPFTISTPPPNAGVPPLLNKAFLPDTDGELISATAVFGWLNDGLKMISRMAGGLLDYAGMPSQINQPLYQLPSGSHWIEITSIWYDGYWMLGGDRGYFYRRNQVTSSILSSATISVINNNMVLEVYPQPARTAAATTLAGGGMLATDTVAMLTSTAGFLLPFGFWQADTEIMAYGGISGNQLTGLIRGLGGSAAVAHNAGAPVQELNIFWNGKRQIDPNFQPGQSASILPIPNGWDVLLAQYISGRAKNIEHDGQYWKQLSDDIQKSIKDWARGEKGVVRRRQVGPPSQPGIYYPTQAGGLLIN